MRDRWINIETLKKASDWSQRKIEEMCNARKGKPQQIQWRPMKTGRKGRPPREYDVLSLPAEVQARINGSTIEPSKVIVTSPIPSQTQVGSSSQQYRLAVTTEDEDEAHKLYEQIRPYIDFCNDPTPRMMDGEVICTRERMAAVIERKEGWSVSKVRRLYRRYIEGGRDAMLRKVRADKGKSRFFEAHPKAAAHAAYVYLEQRQSARCAYEAIVRDRESLCVPEGELPTYESVRCWLNAIPPVYVTLAREGRRSYRERMAPYISRAYDEKPNEIWVSDHMIHDVEAQNDCFRDAEWGAPIRLRFTCLLDFRARFVVGTSWCWEGSSDSIASALRQAVMKYGPARMLYCDNGKDYLKVAKGAMPGYLRSTVEPEDWYARELQQVDELGVIARLGMSVQHCIVRHPQSKHVERFFRTVHERFDKKFPTYTGGSPATRPDFTADAMAHHRRLLRMGQPQRSRHPMASEIIRMCQAWIEEYHQRTQTGKGMGGRSPADVFAERESRPVPDQQVLALLLLERERRRVRECAVTLNKGRYIGCDETGRAILHELNECDVIVAYDRLDTSEAAILDLNGNLLTFARAEHFLPQSPAAHEAIAESMAERRRLEKQTASTIVAIGDEARKNGAVTEVEHLARKAQLMPMAVGDHITQRRVRIRPDETATAPPSAGDITRMLVSDLGDE